MSLTRGSRKQLNKSATLWVTFAGALALLGSLCCASQTAQEVKPDVVQKKYITNSMQVPDDQLMSLVKQIAAGADERSEPWKELHTISREPLVARLQVIMKTVPKDNRDRLALAFVFCLLDHDYENSKGIIVQELLKEPRYKNLDADWEAELIHRLIVRGDTHLLPTLFAAATWVDGATAASLSGYLTYHMRNRPEQFLLELKPESRAIRLGVYDRILSDELLQKKDLVSIMRYLGSVPKTSRIFDVAHEMLLVLRKEHSPRRRVT